MQRRTPGGIDACLGRLAAKPTWSVLAGSAEDRSTPPSKRQSETGDLMIQVLLYLGFVRAAPFASGLLATWQENPQSFPATIGRLVAWTSPYLNPPGEVTPAAQTRAFRLFANLTAACVSIPASAHEPLASGQQAGDEIRQDLEAAAWIAHCIAREIYHASGAFQTQQEKAQPDERIVSPSFCSLALPVIETLAGVRTAGIAHPLVQTPAFLSRVEPRRAFMAVAKIVIPGSGYEYESLGEGGVLDLVDLYLAEARHGSQRPGVPGRPAADPGDVRGCRIRPRHRRVQDLGELFT